MKFPAEDAPLRLRATLDWDTEPDKEEFLPMVRGEVPEGQATFADLRDPGEVWELWESANHGIVPPGKSERSDGYHYLEWDAAETVGDVAALRRRYGDDQIRYRRDRSRWQHGSPYYQVLYDRKGLRPHSMPPYAEGTVAERIETHGYAPEAEDTKNPHGTVNWPEIVRAAAEEVGGQAALGRRLADRARSSPLADSESPRKVVYNWAHGRNDPATAHKAALRRLAKKESIGHYRPEGALEAAEVPFDTVPRRSYTEGLNIPWFGDDDEAEDADHSPSRNVMVRTGYFGTDAEAAPQERTPDAKTLRQYHEAVMEHVKSLFKPGNWEPEEELERAEAGVHLERKPLHDTEAAHYLENTERYCRENGACDLPASVYGQHVVIHIILWNEDFSEPLWVFIGLAHGAFTEDAAEVPRGVRVCIDDPPDTDYHASGWWR